VLGAVLFFVFFASFASREPTNRRRGVSQFLATVDHQLTM
jgi:hypothetical protein